MRVYLACAMTNPERDATAAAEVLRALTEAGHEVLNPHVILGVEEQSDASLSDAALFQRDMNWLSQADVVIAEVSTPSHGVGMEIMAACALKKPVFAVAHQASRVSRLLSGFSAIRLARYATPEHAAALVLAFLSGGCPQA